ncbi:glycosyltransferase [Neptuniibacter caesariensis]|uniref:Putative glycosyl transferase n=1 Tax=Neptuniibacter caesariensis TaxID=207954 RepID=A0A7U8C7B7_NEPCE|nr:glycosyltransferase [Neptuniibacter caesariensis]EAR62011.1 putative glycosyl transferase [Oceanospirillum sp. MED92] [Neptuniibacter caesariensis]
MKDVIVQVVQHLRPGGIETMALDLLNQLNPRAEVYIFSLEGTKKNALAHWPRLRSISSRLRFFNKAPDIRLKLISELKSALLEVGATAVHTHHIGPLLYGGAAAKLMGVKHIHTEHDAWHLNSRSNRNLQNLLIRLIRPKLIADCEEVAGLLNQYYPYSQPEVILNGIDINRFTPPEQDQRQTSRKKFNLPEDLFLIGCAARLETVKGHKYLLKALKHCDEKTGLVLAGSGSLRRHLKREADHMGISDRVFFLGHVDNVVPFYHAIDLFCLPSLNEGLPLSPLEAQACGIPVVATDVGGCSSILCPQSSELAKPGSTRSLIQGIQEIQQRGSVQDPRQFVLLKGSLEKTADAYFNLLSCVKEA